MSAKVVNEIPPSETEIERQRFEEWIGRASKDFQSGHREPSQLLTRSKGGGYFFPETRLAWLAWIMRGALEEHDRKERLLVAHRIRIEVDGEFYTLAEAREILNLPDSGSPAEEA